MVLQLNKSGTGLAKARQLKSKVSRSSRSTQNLSFSIDRLECDDDDMAHHCHSDLDYDERDPYFEYNKCNQFEYLEKKLQGKLEEFVPIDLNLQTDLIGSRHIIQTKCDLLEELDRIIKRKYLHAMQELVNPDPIMDKREEKTFHSYL